MLNDGPMHHENGLKIQVNDKVPKAFVHFSKLLAGNQSSGIID